MAVTSEVVSTDETPKAALAALSIAAAAAIEPVLLEEAKLHLRVATPDEDSLIQGLITAARMALEGKINRALVPQTVTRTFSYLHSGMVLPVVPFVGDLLVAYPGSDGELTTLDPAAYVITDEVPPRLHPARGSMFPTISPWPGAVTVQYTAGYVTPADVPAPLKQWILLAIGTMYDHRTSVVAGVSVVDMPDEFMKMLWHPYKVYA